MNNANEVKLDRLADAIEAAQAIANDDNWTSNIIGKQYVPAFLHAIRNHKAEVVKILAFVDDADADSYEIDAESIFRRLMQIYRNDDVRTLTDLFMLRAQKGGKESSGPAMENTGAGAQ